MIYPTTERVLESVLRTLDEVIKPALRRDFETAPPERQTEAKRTLSTSYTLTHLLRHCRNRVAEEGQIYFDEIAALEPLIADIAGFARRTGGGGAADIARALDAAVGEAWLPPGRYPSLSLTAERTNRLRLAVQDALAWLQDNHAALAADPGYAPLRGRIRDYIGEQLKRENDLVDRSYRGFGLRR